MPLLDSRKEDILGFVVRDFVRTAFPVSSNAVFGGLRLEVSPATIRNIMLELDDMGYLYQPHTSAGRAPTEKGYRYFTLHLMSVKQPEVEMRTRLENIEENLLDLNRRGVTEHDLEPTFHVSGFGMASVFFDDDEFGRCAVFSA